MLPRDERERIRHQWTRGIGSVALSLIPFETADQPTRVDVRGPDPLLDLVEQIAQRFGPRISGLPDRLNPRVKPEVAVDAPIDDFDDWEAAVSMLTAVQGQPFVPELPSGMPPLWTVMQRQSLIQAAHQACSILGGFAPGSLAGANLAGAPAHPCLRLCRGGGRRDGGACWPSPASCSRLSVAPRHPRPADARSC
ncbi:MAG: hypothetical protein KFB96_01340 [Thiocapsa sp.]|nr:MAG: hypothetical protein KFB96_01340 [Thiocapsa sp.]